MSEFWNQFEGSTTGAYVLGACRHAEQNSAYFEAESENGGAVVRLAAGGGAGPQLGLWRRIAGLSHAHLLRMIDTGWLERDSDPLAYAVFERPDEHLGAVLEERALTAEEAGQALLAAAEALAYIHEEGLVHGELGPWGIVAAGDDIKIPCDALRPSSEEYPAENDVRALALTACEMLTRHVPAFSGGEPRFAPEDHAALAPFEKLIRNCLRNGNERWTARRAAAFLRDPRVEEGQERRPAPAAVKAVPSAAAPSTTTGSPATEVVSAPAVPPQSPQAPAAPRPIPRRPLVPRWAYGIAGAFALGGILFLGTRGEKKESPAAPPAASVPAESTRKAPAPAGEPTPAPRVTPARRVTKNGAAPAADVSPDHTWRVIAYTYNGPGPAEKKAHSINRRWPQFKAEVFAPERHRGPYLISLNGRMSHEQALRLQHTARAKGLPRDTYVQNYGRH